MEMNVCECGVKIRNSKYRYCYLCNVIRKFQNIAENIHYNSKCDFFL